jgi:hypothetical protein
MRASQVSWLEAAGSPSQNGVPSQWHNGAGNAERLPQGMLGPLTVAGPRRLCTGFRDVPPASELCADDTCPDRFSQA